MLEKNIQIYSGQITVKCILWNLSPLGMIWSLVPLSLLQEEQSPNKFAVKNLFPHEKPFSLEKVPTPNTLGGEIPEKDLPK